MGGGPDREPVRERPTRGVAGAVHVVPTDEVDDGGHGKLHGVNDIRAYSGFLSRDKGVMLASADQYTLLPFAQGRPCDVAVQASS